MEMEFVKASEQTTGERGEMPRKEAVLHGPIGAGPSIPASTRSPGARTSEAKGAGIVVSVHEDLSTLRHEWEAFQERADCLPYQLFGWLCAWQAHIGKGRGTRPAVVIARDAGGEILCLLPLAIERRAGLSQLTWLGSDNCDYNAPLLVHHFSRTLDRERFLDLWRAMLREIRVQTRQRIDLVRLDRMPENVGVQKNPFMQLRLLPSSSTWVAHLTGDWNSFYARISSATRRGRDRRSRKLLGTLGEIRYVEPCTAEDIAQTMDTLFEQKALALKKLGVRSLINAPGYTQFYRFVAADESLKGVAHVCRLDVGGKPVGVNFGLQFRGRYYGLLLSHADGEAARFSPGTHLLHEVIRHAIEARCTQFDFTTGGEAYKRQWTDTEYRLFHHVGSVGWRGILVAPLLSMWLRAKHSVAQSSTIRRHLTSLRALTRGGDHKNQGAGGPAPKAQKQQTGDKNSPPADKDEPDRAVE